MNIFFNKLTFSNSNSTKKNQKLGKLQPYYDDDRDPIMDTDELDSEEDIILVGNTNQDEYHD